MRKIGLKTAFCITCFLILFVTACKKELVISREVKKALDKELSKSLRVYPLDLEEGKKIDEALRDWVSGSIDLDRAKRRESERFKNRVTYYQEMEENVPRFIKEKMDKQGLKNPRPIEIFYSRGPNWFSFRKLLDVEAKSKIERDEAIEMVREFLLRNNFVKITEFDSFGDTLAPELKKDEGSDPDSPGKEVLMMQGVKFRREFREAPVVNSRISVDFHPDTEEILGFKHYNWTPVKEGTGVPIPKELVKTSSEIQDNLMEKVRKYCEPSERAKIEKITPAWFQTDTELIPILSFEIEVVKIGQEHEHRYTEYINVAGSDDVFYPPRRQKVKPKVAPK